MVLRKGRLQKPCKKCKELYEPTGRYDKLCLKCKPNSATTFYDRLQKISKKNKKEGKD
ncbi:hypothetical protein LCGC14_3082530 [marine sediment metagenome]|uniref:Uncharacterized protein n=1 Tax=marine sediment metagenome TaxID=412755 RepID=A0A0F8WDP7_9ZZZZ